MIFRGRPGAIRRPAFMGQAEDGARRARLMEIVLCPTGPSTMDVVDAVTGVVMMTNQPGAVEGSQVCLRLNYPYGAPPAGPAAPASTPMTVPQGTPFQPPPPAYAAPLEPAPAPAAPPCPPLPQPEPRHDLGWYLKNVGVPVAGLAAIGALTLLMD